MNFRRTAMALGIGATAMLVIPSTALAAGNNDKPITAKDLEAQGYTCEVVATGFTECTKKGEKTYWCDTICQPAPRGLTRPPGNMVGPIGGPKSR